LRACVFHSAQNSIVVGGFAFASLGAKQREGLPRRRLPKAKARRSAPCKEIGHQSRTPPRVNLTRGVRLRHEQQAGAKKKEVAMGQYSS